MIVFVTTASHAYTLHDVAKLLPEVKRAGYPFMLRRKSLPRATYVFTDLDRLDFWQLELAAHMARSLRDAGCRVLNDPARTLSRLPLLRRLHRMGINSFKAWPGEEVDLVDRFPVFVRTRAAHRGNLTELLPDAGMLAAEFARLLGEGFPVADLMIVEYRAEPLHGDVFRKLSVYRVGEIMCPSISVHQRSWAAKLGEAGVAGESGYEEELELIRRNAFADAGRTVFEAAGADFGRADFGWCGGRPEFYEVNTNPDIGMGAAQPDSPARRESMKLSKRQLLDAIAALDSPERGPPVRIAPHPALGKPGWRRWLWPGYSWKP